MNEAISTSLWIYGLAAVVSFVIAAVIKVIVVVLGRAERAPAVPAPAVAAPAASVPGVPAHHLAVISAAVYASLGEHRILHIEPGRRGTGWAADGRHVHHTSHAPPTHPARR